MSSPLLGAVMRRATHLCSACCITTAGVLLLLTGCHPDTLAPTPKPAPPNLQVVSRGKIVPNVSAVPIEPAGPPPSTPAQYALLTARECSTLAFQNAPMADELLAGSGKNSWCRKDSEEAKLERTVRCYAADDRRNSAVGDALELYYKLAAAEGQYDLVAAGENQLRPQLADAQKAEQQGLRDRADVHAIQRQLLESEAQLAKLKATITVLNTQLRGKIGLDPGDGLPIWPSEPLRVRTEEISVEEAVATGLQYRPDLNLLRTLASGGKNGGKLANAMLKSVNPLLGATDPNNCLVILLALMGHPSRAASTTERQIKELLDTRERQASGEIQSAVAIERGALATVAVKQAQMLHLEHRVADLEKKVAAGVAGAINDLAVTRLEKLKVQGELLGAVADWHIADVKLRQAMGLLVRE